MRFPLLAAAIALGLAACGNNDQRDNTANVDENLSAENIVSNDVTAIDAVTSDAANMAADVNYMTPVDNGTDNSSNAATSSAASPEPRVKSSAPAAKPQPASSNTAANSATNATE